MSTFTTKDKDLLYEAYRSVKPTKNLMLEDMMPTEPGESWGSDIDPQEITQKQPLLNKPAYMGGKVPAEHVDKAAYIVCTKVKAFLASCANSTFPGEYAEFRDKIAEIILADFPSIGKASAKYSARAIQGFLVDKEIISDERNGKLRVTKAATVIDPDSILKKFEEAKKSFPGGNAPSSAPGAAPAAKPTGKAPIKKT